MINKYSKNNNAEIGRLIKVPSSCLTKRNVYDRKAALMLMKHLKLAADDKGYLGQDLADTLQRQELKLMTKVRKNMKRKMHLAFDKFFLKKRGIVETIKDQNIFCQVIQN